VQVQVLVLLLVHTNLCNRKTITQKTTTNNSIVLVFVVVVIQFGGCDLCERGMNSKRAKIFMVHANWHALKTLTRRGRKEEEKSISWCAEGVLASNANK
jgi:hypothetical protein